jgi:cytochrome c556
MNKPFSISASIAAVVALVAIGVTAVTANAQTSLEIVKHREGEMKKLGGHMKAITGFFKKDVGTAGDVARRAGEIGEIAAKIPSMFPEGTEMNGAADSKYKARPELWLDWENFEKAAARLESKSKALAAAASGGDKAAIAEAFTDLGKKGCGGCHETFRMKIN